ncbi:MAG: restriction endonuclease subunit S [Bacteroides sp.]|nr:restriction endonuclease subunit S [Bacteroides sp.]
MKIKDIVTFVSKSITPKPGVTYNLYSLPSFDEGKTSEILDGTEIQSNKYDVPNKCILFNKLNVRFRRVWKVDNYDENKISSTEFLPLVVNENVVDFQYCYYLLISDRITNYLCGQNTNTSGSHKRIDPNNFLDIEITLPKMSIQKQIGKTLSALDCKIELNKRINDNLEAMAKQLYDYWFVQFDFPNEEGKPYKSSGGAMVWNEKLKREIPQGWSVSNVKSLIEPIERGISYSSDDLLDPFATPMINLACFSKAGDYRLGEMKFFSGKVSNDKLISPMDMLIACTDMTQGADIIGRPILASDEYDQYTFSTDLALITPKGKLKMYLYYTLRTSFYHKYIRPFASGTTVKHLNLIGVENYGLPVPPIEIQSKFEDLITPIKEKQSKNLNEINALTKQRDELLPLLMNGQASVNSD